MDKFLFFLISFSTLFIDHLYAFPIWRTIPHGYYSRFPIRHRFIYPVPPFTTTTTVTPFNEEQSTTTPIHFLSPLTNEYSHENVDHHKRTTTIIIPSLIIDI